MYLQKSNVSATKSSSYTDYLNGSVVLENKEVTLHWDSFTKRENYLIRKVY